MKWTVHLEGGPRRVNHAAVAVGKHIFSFGGYCTGDNYKDIRPIDIFVLNTITYRWTSVQKPKVGSVEAETWPFQRYGHTVSAHQGKVYLFGGRNDNQACNILYCFDTITLKWSIPRVCGCIPAARDGHSSCIFGDAMYIFGGYEDSAEPFRPDVYKLDLTCMEWTLLKCKGEPPMYRDFHTATAVGDKMFIFGGRSDKTANELHNYHHHFPGVQSEFYSDKLVYLDIPTLRWETPAISSTKPRGRRSHSAINLDGDLLIFGGYNGYRREHMNDLWLLETSSWTWSEIKPSGYGPDPRRRQNMQRVGSQIFLFGGTSPHEGPQIAFTPAQQQFMPDQQQNNLIDHNDVFVLDLKPSLRTLCLVYVINHRDFYNLKELPAGLRHDMDYMTKDNSISEPLRYKTLPLG